jgi:L-aspartate oxidase
LVFGRRCAEQINSTIDSTQIPLLDISNKSQPETKVDAEAINESIKSLMNEYAGIERNERDMNMALCRINEFIEQLENSCLETTKEMETVNIANIASLILKAAIRRKESVGSHYRVN